MAREPGIVAGELILASPPLLLLDRSDLVPHPGGGLVVLGGDGPLQLVAELDQGRLLLGVPQRLGTLPECRVSSWIFSSSGISSSRKTS